MHPALIVIETPLHHDGTPEPVVQPSHRILASPTFSDQCCERNGRAAEARTLPGRLWEVKLVESYNVNILGRR